MQRNPAKHATIMRPDLQTRLTAGIHITQWSQSVMTASAWEDAMRPVPLMQDTVRFYTKLRMEITMVG
jgi:hypothetical protein